MVGRAISNGYVMITHKDCYITFEHIQIFEQYHKCSMLKWGIVHHINNIKNDNRVENLEGMTRRQHFKLHHKKPWNFGRTGIFSEEVRKRISEANKRRPHHIMPQEIRKKISQKNKGHIGWNKGGTRTEEEKKNISLAKLGHSVSDKSREKMSQKRKEWWNRQKSALVYM